MGVKLMERWLGLSREEERVLWDRSMIFGYGPRVCLGKEYFLRLSVIWEAHVVDLP